MHRKISSLFAGLALAGLLFHGTPAFALGECGLACCIAGATTSPITQAGKFGLAVQYEHSDMETIRQGTDAVNPNKVLDRFWAPGSSFAVPTRMTMEKISLLASYPVSARWQLLGIVPYVRNEMDMRVRNAMGMTMDMSMDPVTGLGDVTLLSLYTAYTDAPLRPTERVTLGFGLKTPTGENDARTASGAFVHAMMQAGTGSWDPLFMVNYLRAWYPVVTQVNFLYHLSTKGDEGYEFGDQVSLDFIVRRQFGNYTNLGLELNGVYAGRDKDHDGKYSRPAVSLVDNTANTGLTSVFLSAGAQFKLGASGGSLDLKYQRPIHQDVNGFQQVVDWRVLATLGWSF